MSNRDTAAHREEAISAHTVAFSYGKMSVLRDLDLSVRTGAIYGLLGANGAGKTTLIRLLVGLLKPAGGTIRVLGQEPSPAQLGGQVGYMPQLNALYLGLSVRENVDFFARMYGMKDGARRREAVKAVIDLVALSHRSDDAVQNLSGGMRQRVSLACALVHTPPLLVLDEPTVGLDPELRAGFWDHFRSLVAQGVTILISSHTMDDAAHCDRLAFLQDGRVLAEGSPADLRAGTGKQDATLEDAFLHYIRQGGKHVPG